MKLKVQNLGVIRNASIDLDKKLTVFCGPNNTGKTYMSYVIYALTKNKLSVRGEIGDENTQRLLKNQSICVEIDPPKVIDYKKRITENITEDIDTVFGISDEAKEQLFNDFKIEFTSSAEESSSKIFEIKFKNVIRVNTLEFTLIKDANSLVVQIDPSENNDFSQDKIAPVISMVLLTAIYNRLAIYPINESVIFPVERISIYTFKTELSLSRNALIDQMQKISRNEKINPFDLIDQGSKRYPQAIKDGLYIANDLANVQKNKSPYFNIAEEIESKLLGGCVSANKDGDVLFVSNRAGKSKKLPIHMTASIVKTLSSLVFYLKYLASEDELIIIDEPEMNLHPDSQVELVDIFSKLLNKGLRLLISTHSDYIIREINNLIMASSTENGMPRVAKEIGYTEENTIKKEDVGIYYFNFTTKNKVDVKEIKVQDTGFDVASIDRTIGIQNKKVEELFYTLKHGADE